ncbi:MAG: hypothetical protein GXN93_02000 [Candidatus Diapherotrites archaeon]|nr:hypothetical protein [Candidatus Diapherotrites archaeon]
MDAVLRRGVRRAMLPAIAMSDPKEYKHVVAALRRQSAEIAAAFDEIISRVPRDRPNTFIVPGRSGRFLFRIFWEYVKELEKERGRLFERSRPIAITAPLRPRRIYLLRDGKTHPVSDERAAHVIKSVVARHPLYLRVFDAARKDQINLVYLDPYEYQGKTRRAYELLASMFGVPARRMHSVVLSKSQNPGVRDVAELLDVLSSHASWLDIDRKRVHAAGEDHVVQQYVRATQPPSGRRIWW